MELRNLIQNIAIEFPAYGYSVTAELRNRGYKVNHKRVLRLMREDNLFYYYTRLYQNNKK